MDQKLLKLFTPPLFDGIWPVRAGHMLAFVLLLVAAAPGAMAAAPAASDVTLGTVICNAGGNLPALITFITVIAYIIAAYFAVQMLATLVRHYSGANDAPMTKVVALGLVSGALAALPALVVAIQNTMFGSVTGGNNQSCAAGGVTAAKDIPLDKMMNNFVANIYDPMFLLLSIIAFTIGIFLIVKGMLKAAKTGTDPRVSAPHVIAAYLIVGGILASTAPMLDTMLQSLFASSAIDPVKNFDLKWAAAAAGTGSMDAANNAARAVLGFVQIIGGIAFIRGFLVMKNAVEGSGQATVAAGLTHIIGGTMAINIVAMLKVIDKTFGTGLL